MGKSTDKEPILDAWQGISVHAKLCLITTELFGDCSNIDDKQIYLWGAKQFDIIYEETTWEKGPSYLAFLFCWNSSFNILPLIPATNYIGTNIYISTSENI